MPDDKSVRFSSFVQWKDLWNEYLRDFHEWMPSLHDNVTPFTYETFLRIKKEKFPHYQHTRYNGLSRYVYHSSFLCHW